MEELLTKLKALSDNTRLKLVILLLNNDYCGKALAKRLSVSESAVSQHLKVLREAGLVKGEKRGYWVHYSVNKERLKEIAQQVANLEQYFEDDGCSVEKECCPKEKS
ncbi:ArsR/SmtB family transcription factor [Fuchsiella alkaliacetigena]|uniref:ArsR/SmtB family transcription factor n=1 Tax=Fuchsiella alkaliacetigena TaxID=957042 RepID=UPI00200B7860|nr:metalloregulator ArsR/SmtB family transcription factor [Fuchsiella alkaliacetigena]MCK8825766.1 metalloregulator ArsR/SmtB family transcription factor [Fuchsiella alkaliacetigena]